MLVKATKHARAEGQEPKKVFFKIKLKIRRLISVRVEVVSLVSLGPLVSLSR